MGALSSELCVRCCSCTCLAGRRAASHAPLASSRARAPPGPPAHLSAQVSDTQGLRQRIQNQFELASLPGTTDDDMRQSLHFVVVGGGPTGERGETGCSALPACRLGCSFRAGAPTAHLAPCAALCTAAAGVEFAGTLSDFLREDLKRKYPELMPYVQVTLLNSAPTILGAFDEK